MKIKTQTQTLAKMEAETRKDMRRFENDGNTQFLIMWAATRKDIKAAIVREYMQDFGSGTWDIATANSKGTLGRIEKSINEHLTVFYSQSHNFIKTVLSMVHHLEVMRALWMLDQTTPPHIKPVYPNRPSAHAHEAMTPADYKATWPQVLSAWVQSYKDALLGGLRMEILHEGSVQDAAAEVDSAKIDNFDPAYKFESFFSTQAIQTEAQARRYVADENPEVVMDEIWQAMEDSRDCETCDEYNGKRRDEIDEEPPQHFNCRCYWRLVPHDWANLLVSGDADAIATARQMDAEGMVPDAMSIRDEQGKLAAHLVVDFPTWASTRGADYAPIQGGI